MSKRILPSLVVIAWLPTHAGADGAVPVSPGAADRFLGTASACPTFSWSGVEGAEGYELIVYAMPYEEGTAAAVPEWPTVEEGPAIRAVVPAGALSWTPSSESCLDLAGAYAWSVRALGGVEDGAWSESRLFKVDAAAVAAGIGDAMERALSRFLNERGISYRPDGELAPLLEEELGGAVRARPAPPPTGVETRWVYRGGKRVPESDPIPAGVFTEDAELWLEETGSGAADKVQIVFATPEFDGGGMFGDAWSIVVEAENSADPDDGRMLISTPSFFDAAQFYTDGSVILGEQREMKLQLRSSPPIACTSFLQEGMFYWDDQANALCVCDGSSWKPVDADETGTCA